MSENPTQPPVPSVPHILRPLNNPKITLTNKDKPADYTGDGDAPERVLKINLGIFKYGTNDKAHGASVALSLLLIILMGFVVIFGSNAPWFDKVFSWVGNAFLLIAGVAIGKSNFYGEDDKRQN